MKNRITALFILAAMLSSVASCSDTASGTNNDDTTSNQDTTVSYDDSEFVYEYPSMDLNEKEITILNGSISWGGFIYQLDYESYTGETLDDAIYNRNRKIENEFNCRLTIVEEDIHSTNSVLQKIIMSQEDVYQAAFVKGSGLANLVSEGYLQDLSDIASIDLDGVWWNKAINDDAKFGSSDSLYFASSDISLVSLQGTVAVYFNEDKIKNFGMDTPYQLVKDGKWTLDELAVYMKAGANLNGDSTYIWDSTANAEYGLVTWTTGVSAFVTGCNESYIDKDSNNEPYLGCNDNRFFDVLQKLAGMFGNEGEFLLTSGAGVDHYETIFSNNRALMLVAELKAATKYREIDINFGIVPMPKYDENQENYYSYRWQDSYMLCIPVTNLDAEETGAVMDAMAYISYESVLPIFYENTLSQKALRNENSIEMLGIIRDSATFNMGRVYGWTEQLSLDLEAVLKTGSTEIASVIEASRGTIEGKIEATMDVMNN